MNKNRFRWSNGFILEMLNFNLFIGISILSIILIKIVLRLKLTSIFK